MKLKSKNTIHSLIRGFTLVEAMVSVGIMVLLMTIVLFNYGAFNDNLALSSAGQEMAIAVRQAQTYGLNVKETKVGSGDFIYAYGIYFDITTDGTTNKDYYIFTDSDGDNRYDVGSGCGTASTECVEKVSFRNGVKISSITATGGCPVTSFAKTLHITFLRPSPDAIIYFFNSSGATVCSPPGNEAQIVLVSVKGRLLTVTVDKTGQVYTQ